MTRTRSSIVAALATVLGLAVTSFATGTAPAVAAGDGSPVSTPDNIRADIGASSVTLEWEPSTSREAEVTGYTVKVGTQWFWPAEPRLTLFLKKSTGYRVEVQANDAEFNRSNWSEPFFFTTSDEFPVTTPSNVRVSTSPGSLTVEWDPSSSDAGVRDYLVSVQGAPLFCSPCGTLGGRTENTSISFPIPPGADASLTVRAQDNAFRYSDTSDPVAVTVPPADDWEPPGTPTNFRATPTATGVLFQWDEPAEGTRPLTYEIYLDGSAVEQVRGATELDSEYFFACTQPWQIRAEFTITAKSYGVTSPHSEPITLCF